MTKIAATGLVLLLGIQTAASQTVFVSGRDTPADLDSDRFAEYQPQQTNAIRKIYYDRANEYLIYQLRTVYYQKCGVPADVIEEWLQDDSTNGYFTRKIKERYECRADDVPVE